MKVLNLRCRHEHVFEGWFASEDDFVSQCERKEVACPLCGETEVLRLPSAPRLLGSRAEGQAEAPSEATATKPSPPAGVIALQSQWLRAVRHVLANTEDVGARFPEEARKIHYGEVAERGIRGQASREDAEALRDEGIEVMAMPLPKALDGPVQ